MKTQLITPSSATTNTPCTTPPSTHDHFPTYYHSAPTTPFHTTFHNDNDDNDEEYDFAFDFNGQLEPLSISPADELFHCGQIKTSNTIVPDHHKSPTFSIKKPEFYQTKPAQNSRTQLHESETISSRFRISDILSEQDNYNLDTNNKSSLTWYNKWNFKKLLLFRSTSEGSGRRAKDAVNRYAKITKGDEGLKGSSFRSTESCGSGVGSSKRVMTRKVSAHEVHYMANRAVYEEMRRKTYLPYKSGLLGCLGFRNNIGAGIGTVHEISRGVGCVVKQ